MLYVALVLLTLEADSRQKIRLSLLRIPSDVKRGI